MSEKPLTTWDDIVILDTVGVAGKTLAEALYDFWRDNDWHDTDPNVPCTCAACQVFAPMAHKLERQRATLLAACEGAAAVFAADEEIMIDWDENDPNGQALAQLRAAIAKARSI